MLKLPDMLAADQVLCGTNATRKAVNRMMRDSLIEQGKIKPIEKPDNCRHLPGVGDRLVCLRNNHELGLLNGSIWYVLECTVVDDDTISLLVEDEANDANVVRCNAHRHHFEDRELAFYERLDANEFFYGYVLTCHKSQGSEWDHVIVIDQGHVFRDHARRWRYTAITRAAKRIQVIKTT